MPKVPDDPVIDASLYVDEAMDALRLIFVRDDPLHAFFVELVFMLSKLGDHRYRYSDLERLRAVFAAAVDTAE